MCGQIEKFIGIMWRFIINIIMLSYMYIHCIHYFISVTEIDKNERSVIAAIYLVLDSAVVLTNFFVHHKSVICTCISFKTRKKITSDVFSNGPITCHERHTFVGAQITYHT